jgi:hypothetical protein
MYELKTRYDNYEEVLSLLKRLEYNVELSLAVVY